MRTILIVLFGTLCCLAKQSPNVVLLFADDLGRYASAYADPSKPSPNDLVKTPVFDRIAREGVRFDNAFVSAPSCTPSRGALYTGRHFFRNGAYSQLHSRWDPKDKGTPNAAKTNVGMPEMLARSGYHIGWSHKWHLPPKLMRGKKNEYSPKGNRICNFSEIVTEDPGNREMIFEEVRANFRAFLAGRKNDQPFFYSFNPTNTHRAWVRGSGKALWGLDPEELEGKLPPFLPNNPLVREDFADYLGEAMAFDQACGVILDELESRGELGNTLVIITGDHGAPGFPRGKCQVHDFGSRVLLGMSWPGQIRRETVIDTPVSLIDLAPTILAAAGTTSPDNPDGQNLLPVLVGKAPKESLRGWALIGREVHVGVAREDYLPYPVRALRTPEFLYVRNFKPDRWPMGDPLAIGKKPLPTVEEITTNTRIGYADIDASPTKAWMMVHENDEGMELVRRLGWQKREGEELYDLAEDPHQIHNLAEDPGHAEKLRSMRDQLMTELKAKQDPRLDGDAFDKLPYSYETSPPTGVKAKPSCSAWRRR